MESLHEISNFLNENAARIKEKMCRDRAGAAEFLEICEANGFECVVTRKETGENVPWREAPDYVVIALALQMFDNFRTKVMH